MILTCPECATRYEIDAAKFPAAGRKVRCKKCGHIWFQAGEHPESVAGISAPAETLAVVMAEPIHEFQPEPVRVARTPVAETFDASPVAAKRSPRFAMNVPRNAGVIAGWAGLVLVILIIGWAATSYHRQIATDWPKSSSLFARMGMPVNARGLDFADVQHASQSEDGQPVLVITGKLVNVGTRQIKVPPLRVTLSDKDKHAIYGWSFSPSATSLAPGQAVTFHTRLSNPPSAARHVEIHFADGAE